MKKIFSLVLIFVGLFLLSACSGSELGEFPEINENKKVDMTAEELNTLMSTVDIDTQMKEAMMLSIDLDMTMVENTYEFDYTSMTTEDITRSIELILSSKTYLFLSEQVDEVGLVSNNKIDLKTTDDYANSELDDVVESLEGDLDIYFTNQYLYMNSDLTSTEDNELSEIGKVKINMGITQTMWDELFTNPEGLLDDFVDVGINPEEMLGGDEEIMAFMLESGMISVYKDGSTYTFMINITKEMIVDNINNFIDLVMDTTDWTTSDYNEYSFDITEGLDMFDKLDMSIAVVIKDSMLQKVGIEMDIKIDSEEMKLDLVGTIIMDMSVELPKFPKDLDTYELSDLFGM